MRVLGTAGHVDHGKSTLVRALTGIDPDRLAEEKQREMTIDLGFAWFSAPSGEMVGLVDVPGHRDFIENMLAGIGGIDAVLFIIAADEGVMPQTREHLAIVDLLGISGGIIVMTKCDMVNDADWLDLVETEIHDTVQNTVLANAPIIRISAHTGAGMDSLKSAIFGLLTSLPFRSSNQSPRLPIDRAFTLSGFGTVVTGTLLDGSLKIGDEVELQPSGQKGKIRGLHSYNQPVEIAQAGSRTAVNITGIDKNMIRRGETLTLPKRLSPTQRVDAYFRHLPDVERPLKHNAQIKFFCGTDEALGSVRLLNDEQLNTGAEGWIQLELTTPIAVLYGDKFILRYPSPAQTIGGGMIVNPHPARRWKRFTPSIIEKLESQRLGTPQQRLAHLAEKIEPVKKTALHHTSGLNETDFESVLKTALDEALIIEIAFNQYMAMKTENDLMNKMHILITDFQSQNPLKAGIPREELRSRLGVKPQVFSYLLGEAPNLVITDTIVHTDGHHIEFTDAQQKLVTKLMNTMDENPFTPPTIQEAIDMIGAPLVQALVDYGELIAINKDIIFSQHAFVALLDGAIELLNRDGQVDVKTMREKFNTTRKYLIPFFEHTDRLGYTKRVGDVRVKGDKAH
ncbi:MAG: selenocysteine-specific translation elongation factor [Anaerolineae bacterium]|jgi:selenocysteine-specific elongation factor|nr:selenocysteine-specific translation elongation factor [Anaerolineae bacterium]